MAEVLSSELSRLGIDPDRHPRSAPSGAENQVFNLAAYVVDPDGPGPQVPTEVRFSWVEMNTGDYSQDGLVNISDLTPLGARFRQTVQHDDPILHGGFASWPTGSPQDSGGANPGEPPASGSGAENWRMSRIDGNSDGEINISDITPIAQNWLNWLDGYRVYRKRPGEPDFSLLPHPSSPTSNLSVSRGDIAVSPGYPVIYAFTDDDLGTATGIYEYFVAPYDATADDEGEQSTVVLVDLSAGGGGTQAPVAVLSADVYTGSPPLGVNFDAAGSYDPDPGGGIAKYEWDTDGDPSTWELDTGTDPTHTTTYITAGMFEQWVRVTDLDGQTGTAFVSINTAPNNEPPVADLIADPSTGTAPIIIQLDARGSTDNDGTLVEFEYDPEGDGTWMAPVTSPFIYHSYQWAGTYTAKVRAKDNVGATDIATVTVTLDGLPPQHAPVAHLVANPASGEAPLEVELDASGSTDQDGDIAAYQWDLDGDGFYTTSSGLNPVQTHIFAEVGTHTVGVKVKDAQNFDDDATIEITVSPGSAFWHTYIADNTSGRNRAETSLAEVNGRPAIAFWDKQGEDIIYVRAEDALGTTWGTPFAIATTTNDWGGKPSLAVIADNPAVSYYWAVNAYHGYLMYTRSSDANGELWLSPLFVAGVDYSIEAYHNALAEINGRPAIAFREVAGNDLRYVRANDSTGSVWPDSLSLMHDDNPGFHVHLLPVDGRPAVSHIQQQNSATVFFQRAADANGSDWSGSGSIEEGFVGNGFGGQECSLAVIAGHPAVCFYDKNGQDLRFIRASNPSGSSWGSEQTLDETAKAGRNCSIAEAGGRAFIIYRIESTNQLMAIHAANAEASSWLAPEEISGVLNSYPRAAEIDGKPAAAYISGNVMYFGVRY